VGFVTLDRNGIIRQANAAARQMLNAAEDRLFGKGFSKFVVPDDWNSFLGALKNTTQQTSTSFELRLVGDKHRAQESLR
jgi:PAS domain S-box-containing protein